MYEKLIERAKSRLDQVTQWRSCPDPANPDWLENAAGYAHEAKALIEFLEIELCGSTGGFDKGQTDKDRDTMRKRLAWVERRLPKFPQSNE